MGEVYQARDTKLDRDVALKVLPEAFTSDPDRLARFEREAKVLASLNHPNIGSIYGLEEAEGVRALVLELVEGPTLADRIKQGPIPIDEALPIAKQIAEALEAAHEQGVIHRDLKPANVKVKEDGMVKVLDFGLAKALDPAPSGDPSESPTLTAAATQMGVIMGTAAYMSPEQARGRRVDRRADIWAFGAVLYEMLTGRRAFEGEDVSVTLADVIRADPAWETLPNDLPAGITTYLRRCLEKEPTQRIRDIGDMRLAIEGAFEPARAKADGGNGARAATRPASRLIPWAAGAVGGAVLALVIVLGQLSSPVPRTVRVSLQTDALTSLRIGTPDVDLAIARDGSRIVYASMQGLFVRPLESFSGRLIDGPVDVRAPFVSPDGSWTGYLDRSRRRLMKIAEVGGPASVICDLPAGATATRGTSWGPDDTIILGLGGSSTTDQSARGLWRVSATGGVPTQLTTPDAENGEWAHQWPDILPGGQAVLFTVLRDRSSAENGQLAVASVESGNHRVLLAAGNNPHYLSTGHIVYAIGSTLYGVGFDVGRLEVTSEPVPLVEDVRAKAGGATNFAVSDDGTLVYSEGGLVNDGFSMVWVDRSGNREYLEVEGDSLFRSPRVSPDGTRIAVTRFDPETGNRDIWIYDLTAADFSRFTFDVSRDDHPMWTPDGSRIAFASERGGGQGIYVKNADGTGQVERLLDHADPVAPYSWDPSGSLLVYEVESSPRTIHVLSLDGDKASHPLLADPNYDQGAPSISPDGRWIAYHSNEFGQDEVFVLPFPDVGRGEWQVSIAGGREPTWSRDGDELYYRVGDVGGSRSTVMLVPITAATAASNFDWATPEPLFSGDYLVRPRRDYSVAPDGQHFLMVMQGNASTPQTSSLNVVLGWLEEVKQLVPSN